MKSNSKQVEASIAKLERYCAGRGWQIKYSDMSDDWCYPAEKKIYINTEKTRLALLYTLIHEIGHMLQQLHNACSYNQKYSALYSKNQYSSDRYRMARLQEEMEAWDVGLNLAKSLRISINEVYYNRIRTESLLTYVTWVAKKQRNRATVAQKTAGNKLNSLLG